MDFSRASYNEKNNRHQQSLQQASKTSPDSRSASSSGYNQHSTLESTSSNLLPGFTKPSVLRTVNSMYKSNTSLDLDLEVSLVERAVSNVHIMPSGGLHTSNPQNNVYQVPPKITTAISSDRRLPNIVHNSAKMRDFSGSHGSIVDVLTSRQLGNDNLNMPEENQRSYNVQPRFV